MGISIDKAFGLHADALILGSKRTELLAQNIANVDTPNYKAKDIDFRAVLAGMKQNNLSVAMDKSDPEHLSAVGGNEKIGGVDVLYRVPFNASLDGNTVETQREQAEFAENTTRYQASLEFLTSRINGLVMAFKGQ